MGTPHYMSPEQITRRARWIIARTFTRLGVVFYQMLTGELPGKQIEAAVQESSD
jgi:serine/threonine protein kinase